jgi:pilus assembly protein Flp/PilA
MRTRLLSGWSRRSWEFSKESAAPGSSDGGWPNDLHGQRDALEFGLHLLQGAAEQVEVVGGGAGVGMGDAIAARGEKTSNQFSDLPGIETCLKQLFSKTGQIGYRELFHYVCGPGRWISFRTYVDGKLDEIDSPGEARKNEKVIVLTNACSLEDVSVHFLAPTQLNPFSGAGLRLLRPAGHPNGRASLISYRRECVENPSLSLVSPMLSLLRPPGRRVILRQVLTRLKLSCKRPMYPKNTLFAPSEISDMKTFRTLLLNLLRDESGQDLIEYALVAGLIGLGAVVAMQGLATKVGTAFNSVGSTLTSAV